MRVAPDDGHDVLRVILADSRRVRISSLCAHRYGGEQLTFASSERTIAIARPKKGPLAGPLC
jgi:hypothetical protein